MALRDLMVEFGLPAFRKRGLHRCALYLSGYNQFKGSGDLGWDLAGWALFDEPKHSSKGMAGLRNSVNEAGMFPQGTMRRPLGFKPRLELGNHGKQG